MNGSTASERRRRPEPPDPRGWTAQPGPKGEARQGDGLPVLAVIVALFVLLAVCIVVAVRYGPGLRKVRLDLRPPPRPPRGPEAGTVRLTRWRRLGSQRPLAGRPATPDRDGSPLPAPAGATGSGLVEVTYL
ncbi:small integral membrane protein 33 [Ornithorhynchus anatinus]|uniref:small integral membrane protein 33 n=1 Tax=Ornithorhynchus anatinus TaxID=9258 RepID=UPI0019D475B6|nr:small integral membrane protein 33 [Ornithorhynchus anatinus]